MTWDEYRDNFDGVPVLFIKKLVRAFGCVVQIHKFVKADAAGCFHSHPAWAVRIILWGGYVDETGDGRWKTWFPGRVGIVAPSFEHRIGGLRNGKSSWTLWLRGPKVAGINVRGCDIPSPLQETCERCQGNGEIVTDWERYKHPHDGDIGDEAVAECPDCGGEGVIDQPQPPSQEAKIS